VSEGISASGVANRCALCRTMVAPTSAKRVAVVHRHRAEHIARPLGANGATALLTEVVAPSTRTPAAAPVAIHQRQSRWRDACGWLGIMAGAAVFVAALAVPLDDPALVMALALGLRGGSLIPDVDC
jgi:hypothetical protein